MRVACIAYVLLFSFASGNKEKWKPKVKVGLADDEKKAKFYEASVFWYQSPWLTAVSTIIVRMISLELLYRHGHEIAQKIPALSKYSLVRAHNHVFIFRTFSVMQFN